MKLCHYLPILLQDLKLELQKSIRNAHFRYDSKLQEAEANDVPIIVGYFLEHPITEKQENMEEITIDK